MKVFDAPDGDLAPDLEFVQGLEGLRQRVVQRIRFFLGEWFLDRAAGTPYQRDVLVRPISIGLSLTAISHAIRSVEGVRGVSDIEGEIDRTTRTLDFRCRVESDYGTLLIAEMVAAGYAGTDETPLVPPVPPIPRPDRLEVEAGNGYLLTEAGDYLLLEA